MACIKIDEKLNKAEQIAAFFETFLQQQRIHIPRPTLPKILASHIRPGLDSDITTTAVLSRFTEIGIPNGPLENGHPNVMEAFAKIMIEEIFDSIQNEARVDVALNPGLLVVSGGANGGGPVTTQGSNPAPGKAVGITQ